MNGSPTEHVTVASSLERAIVPGPREFRHDQVTAFDSRSRGGKDRDMAIM